MHNTKQWYRPDEAAKFLSVSTRTIYRMAGEGDIVAAKVRGVLRIRADSLTRYMDKQAQRFSLDSGLKKFDYQ